MEGGAKGLGGRPEEEVRYAREGATGFMTFSFFSFIFHIFPFFHGFHAGCILVFFSHILLYTLRTIMNEPRATEGGAASLADDGRFQLMAIPFSTALIPPFFSLLLFRTHRYAACLLPSKLIRRPSLSLESGRLAGEQHTMDSSTLHTCRSNISSAFIGSWFCRRRGSVCMPAENPAPW